MKEQILQILLRIASGEAIAQGEKQSILLYVNSLQLLRLS